MNRLYTLLSTISVMSLLSFSTPSEARYTKILTSMVEVTVFCNYYNCTSVIDLGDGVEQYRVIYEHKVSDAVSPDPDRDETIP
ncbi:hypothetical protein CJF42_14915 [Pseudoalteromonas sp. NBT06-2]|uniref:hypothetical protein n=1 Tax=Pseudoalteromonas sp. NBT06-2 TaxID=2025950 RepID=UPI000BA56C0F|nr:hypothetical protein [Pseudoalteromonas sp. NBT06-2]PAJ73631.1 hypothetical protein CJF42_14915 [Pseudoalteromonas sp. NBT06-2]